MTALKQCRKCGQDRRLSEYHSAWRSPDGLKSQCKPCCRAADEARRKGERQSADKGKAAA
jgi:hypothetical protein